MNNTKSLIALSSGILGAAGIGLLSAGQVQAATTATVNYADGATTVWTSPTTGQTAKRYIFKGQSVNLLASQKIGAETWYRIGNGEWVPERYLTISNATPTERTSSTEAPAAQKTARIAYAGGATTVWSTATYTAPTGQYLGYGQTVNITKTETVSGEEWYQLENGGWVPARFTGDGKIEATPTPAAQPVAPSTTTTPVETPATPAPVDTTPAQTASTPTTPTPATENETAPVAESESTPVETPATQESTPAATESSASAQTARTAPAQAQQSTTPAPAETATKPAPVETPAAQTAPTENTPAPTPTAPATTTGNVQAVINLAMAQIGKPYVWGAHGPSSFDCSGLMDYVFRNAAGKSIGGWTVPQESAGYAVSLSNLQPGDLLFWGSQGSSYHVALYIGGGQYIHAPQPGENVKIGSMQYYAPSFARRVF
ncbi:C40 family peptidase [Latilactobacillus fragifolii]|uniref:C40 family peptidase n=1 Tax=Latilactobacillus fragifolii TaxID=2814244 RepID=UPI001ABBDFA7|nr:C40 family peptidase [Latilactobacillus fragifolii]